MKLLLNHWPGLLAVALSFCFAVSAPFVALGKAVEQAWRVVAEPACQDFRREITPALSERSLFRLLLARVSAYMQRRVQRTGDRDYGAPVNAGADPLGFAFA